MADRDARSQCAGRNASAAGRLQRRRGPVASDTRGIGIDATAGGRLAVARPDGFGEQVGSATTDSISAADVDAFVGTWPTLQVGDILPTHRAAASRSSIPGTRGRAVMRSDTACRTPEAAGRVASATAGIDAAARGRHRGRRRSPVNLGRDPWGAPGVLGRAGPSSSCRSMAVVAADRALPRLVRRDRHRVPRRDAGCRVRRLRDASGPMVGIKARADRLRTGRRSPGAGLHVAATTRARRSAAERP